MQTDKWMDAMGMIDDAFIQDARSGRPEGFSIKKTVVLLAAVLLCFASLFASAAVFDPMYTMLYHVTPGIAQKLKPVRLSCVNNGIKMEVISAHIAGSEAHIYISLKDLEGERLDETTDLFDSYRINRAFDTVATCSRVGYDEETGEVTFLISMTMMEGKDIGGEKITFSFTEFLSHKRIFRGLLPGLELTAAPVAPATRRREVFSVFDEPSVREILAPEENGLLSPVEGVSVSAMGFIDNRLHIQVCYGDIRKTDNHGFIQLQDREGNRIPASVFDFWNAEHTEKYEEFIYEVSPEEIGWYQAYGEFTASDGPTKGNWQVTFPLKNME